jgi:Spy/CpxP family protein refolding chaperone
MIAMLAATMAFAQRGGGGGGGDDMGAMGGGMPRPQRLSKAEMFADRLKLTKEQKEPVQKILNDAVKEMAPLRAQIDQARTAIAASIINGGNQDEIKKAMDYFTTTESQMSGVEGKAFAQICALLKPNQQSRAASAFDLLAAVLDPPGTAGRAGFGAGGRRGKD